MSQYNSFQVSNEKYKKKYKRLKSTIKNYVFENAALCDQIAQIQENIAIIKEERRFLLKKLMDYEDAEVQMLSVTNTHPIKNLVPGKRGPKKRSIIDASNKNKINVASDQEVVSSNTPTKKQIQQQINFTTDGHGRTNFPIHLENLTIYSIGDIIPDNTNFYTDNWIYPVGYVATRVYAHPREPERKCTFTCKILDNSGVPQFQIIPDSDYDHVFFGESANICHLGLLETITRSYDMKNLPLKPQGEVFFGLGHFTVKTLIQSAMNFKKCSNFKGFLPNSAFEREVMDPTLDFDALHKLMAVSVYHTVPEIKAEPPDELLE